MDTNYVSKCNMSIDKQDYMANLGKVYRLEQLLQTFAYLTELDSFLTFRILTSLCTLYPTYHCTGPSLAQTKEDNQS